MDIEPLGQGFKAKWMFAALLALLCGVNGLNVANSYVGRNFMSAIAERQTAEFVRQAMFYVAVFVASTVVAVVARFLEERLGLLWRNNVTRRAVKLYLDNGAYYRLASTGGLANPDRRIADNSRTFTSSALSFFLMAFNSTLTIVAFAGVIVSIRPLLSVVTVLYAAAGSYITLLLGRRSSSSITTSWTRRRASVPLLFTFAKTPRGSCWRAARTPSRRGCCIDSTA